MIPREQGFLLLTSQLGDPQRKPLTVAQFRALAQHAQAMQPPQEERELALSDLIAMGYDFLTGEHILKLLSQKELLARYLEQGALQDCYPIPRTDPNYPTALRKKLGLDAPGSLWAKGPIELLTTPLLALVGSRELEAQNHTFAYEVGRQAARHGFTLVSGNARGADLTAQQSCLAYGGKVISVVADRLDKYPLKSNHLYLSEDGFDLPFSAQRALSRNRVIHALPMCVFVAQVRAHKGGTWSGTYHNLRKGWTPVLCFDDGSAGFKVLAELGAAAVTTGDLEQLSALSFAAE